MTTCTQHPVGTPQPFLGQDDAIKLDTQYYTADEATYTQGLINTHFELQSRTSAEMRVNYALDDRKIDYQRQYGLRFSFHNYTNLDIVVVDRLGLPVTIRPERRRAETIGTFVVRKEMYFDDASVAHQAYRNIMSLGQLQGFELTRLAPELGREVSGHRFGRCLSLEYVISEAEIRKGDGRLYHLPTDLVLSFLSAVDTIRHPCSPEFSQDYERFIPNYPDGLNDVRVAFRYISANIRAQPKWVRIGAQVFMLRPELCEPAKLVTVPVGKDKTPTDVELSEYVELVYPATLDATRDGVIGYRCHRFSLDQAKDQLNIYDTLEDARNPGQVVEREKQQHKNELTALAAKNAEREKTLQDKLDDRDSDLRKQKVTMDDLRRARDLEIERIREDNEKATHSRRISSENIKLITVLVTAIVTLAGLYMKYKSTAKAT